jgi:hypothetical protein
MLQVKGNIAYKQFTKKDKDQIFKELSNLGITHNVLLIAYGLNDNVKDQLLEQISKNMMTRKISFYTSHYVSNDYEVPQKIRDNVKFDKEYFTNNKNVGMDYLDVMLDLPDEPLIFTLKSMIIEHSLEKFKFTEINI